MGRYSEAIIGRRGELAAALDSIPELRGTGIGVHDGENQVSTVIRPSNHGSRLTTFVVIEVVVDDVPTPDSMARGGSTNQVRYWTDDRGQRAAVESLGLAFNCGGAVLAGLSVVGSSAATAATGGAAAPLVYLSGAAAVGASLQCGVSIGRMLNVLMDDGQGEHANDTLDNNRDAPATILRGSLVVADIVGLLDGAGGAYRALRTFSQRTAMIGGNRAARAAAARRLFDSMPAHERAQLAQEVAQALRQPLTPQMLRTFVQQGRIAGLGSVRFGETLQNLLRSRLSSSLRGLTLGVVGSVAGGAIGLTGTADRTARMVRCIVANVFQEGASSLSQADGGTRAA